MDLSGLSDQDLQALKAKDLSKVSDAGLQYLKKQSAPQGPPTPTQSGSEPTQSGPLQEVTPTSKYAETPAAPESGLEHMEAGVASAYHHPFTTAAGIAENAVSGMAEAAGKVYGRASNAYHGSGNGPAEDLNLPHWGWQAHTEAGREQQAIAGSEGQQISHDYDVAAGTGIQAHNAKVAAGRMADVAAVAAPIEGIMRAGVMDSAVNAATRPTAEQAANIASNPRIAQTRSAGFKLTGQDVRDAVPSASSDQLPGQSVGPIQLTDPTTVDTIRRDNRALATQKATTDVKLTNTRAIDDSEVASRMKEEGAVYDQLGKAVGDVEAPGAPEPLRPTPAGATPEGTQPRMLTKQFDSDMQAAGQQAASPEGRTAVSQQVEFYRDQFAKGLNGPDAVQTVRQLRGNAAKQMASSDADTQVLGRTNSKIAEAIEDELMRQLPAGNTYLATRFPEARTQLAKLNELQEANKGGQVDPAVYKQMRDSGAPLTGGAAEIADAADAAPHSMAPSADARGAMEGGSVHSGVYHAAVRAGRALVRKLPGMDESSEAFQTSKYGAPAGAGAPAPAAPPAAAPPLSMSPPPGSAGAQPPVQLPLRGTEQATGPGATSPAAQGLPPGRAAFDQQTLAALQAKHSGPSDIRGSGPRPTEPTGTNGPTTGQGETEGTAADFVRRTVAKMAAEGKLPKGLQHIEEKYAGSNARRLEGPK